MFIYENDCANDIILRKHCQHFFKKNSDYYKKFQMLQKIV